MRAPPGHEVLVLKSLQLILVLFIVSLTSTAAHAGWGELTHTYQWMKPLQTWEAENLTLNGAKIVDDTNTPPLTPGMEHHLYLDWSRGDASGSKAVSLLPGQKLTFTAELKPGIYALWIRGRSNTPITNADTQSPKFLQSLPDRWNPLYLDYGLDGKQWTMRCRYDKFYYNIGRFYFSIGAAGQHRLSVGNATTSKVDVLLDRFDLLDVLQNTDRKAYKTETTLMAADTATKLRASTSAMPLDPAADQQLWDKVPDPHDEVLGWGDRLAYDYKARKVPGGDRDPGISLREYESAVNVEGRWYAVTNDIKDLAEKYRSGAGPAAAHRAAVQLCALAQVYPLLDYNVMALSNTAADSGFTYFDQSTGSFNYSGWASATLRDLAVSYDDLFPYLSGEDPALVSIAAANNPSLRSMADIRALIETNLLQYGADQLQRRILRGGDGIWEDAMATVAAVQGPSPVSDRAWQVMLFDDSFMSNQNRGGLVDLFTNGVLRDGCNYIGQANYAAAMAAGMGNVMALTHRYREMGGSKKFDIFSPANNSRALAGATFALDTHVAGGFVSNIGEGFGTPDRARQPDMSDVKDTLRTMWSLNYGVTQDPRLAWLLTLSGRKDESDAEWQRIQQAATSIPSPMIHSDTRALHGFGATFLEAGVSSDNLHDKRAVSLRTSVGRGHGHFDTLDIEIFGKDLRLSPDDGGRWGHPDPKLSRVHNLVEVDGKSTYNEATNTSGTGWLTDLKDVPGVRFAEAAGRGRQVPEARTYRRAVALVDLDEHDSYIFDFWRVKGGTSHTWNFHGPLFDDFTTNAQQLRPVAPDSSLQAYMDTKNSQQGVAPDALENDWKALGSQAHLRSILFGTLGLQYTQGDTLKPYHDGTPDQRYVSVRREGAADLQSGWLHLIEPYEGTPRISTAKQLEMRGGPSPADGGAFAIRAGTRTDVVMYDATGATASTMTRLPAGWDGHEAPPTPAAGDIRFKGTFGLVSWDAGLFRDLTVVGGTELTAGGISVRPAVAKYEGTIRSVLPDYSGFVTDVPVAATVLKNQIAAISNEANPDFMRHHHTSFDVISVKESKTGTVVKLKGDSTTFQSRVTGVTPDKKNVSFELPLSLLEADRNWYCGMTLTNEAQTKFWKIPDTGNDDVSLDGAVATEDFTDANKDGRTLGIIHDYGPGDKFTITTLVNLRRTTTGYDLDSNVAAQVTLPEGRFTVQPGYWRFDRTGWHARMTTK